MMVGVEPVERASLADGRGQRHITAQAIIATCWPCRPHFRHQPNIFSLDVSGACSPIFTHDAMIEVIEMAASYSASANVLPSLSNS
ncbi:hypothetical protein PbB2_01545 [Candidatus Phycosocius bacilliformis]|uniref:Uncharacterized protein n=1 Tax=Candidatus Phycosocius bacilliformis TaxID=1445552 RepID=A0A2P2E9Y9_9PROT|nr:hypothetical protein PbB2_01545 [Candidatus Phycosocius bacilliformis]